MLVKENYVAESGHWYCAKTGKPRYTIIGKNGKERNTTLRDAREHDLVPSVTTVLAQISKPGLTTWLNQQLLLAALTLPRIENESEQDWIDRIMVDSKSASKEASQRGTDIHAVIEQFYRSDVYLPEYPIYVHKTNEALVNAFGPQKWIAEESFAHASGYGGKVDLYAKSGFIVDIKTTEKDLNDIKPYHEHLMQLSAYRNGLNLPMARCANVYVNALTNQAKVIEHAETDLQDAWGCFQCLLMFYKRKNSL
jgi:hypothetical protein